ncbi:hypothetical protein Pcinc_008312 [Petrolisthes cinctipes]|uniref:Uncharacterized protein n=1 Tax=Petrolisthes cinctipes TaxID=88211 RepID=A0AAE1G6T2_PETCI|nr:hypothetical protein Pcinc_008312 [Petrolisthes cinctipes]
MPLATVKRPFKVSLNQQGRQVSGLKEGKYKEFKMVTDIIYGNSVIPTLVDRLRRRRSWSLVRRAKTEGQLFWSGDPWSGPVPVQGGKGYPDAYPQCQRGIL